MDAAIKRKKPDKASGPMPGEMREAAEWLAQKELGEGASRLAVASWVKRMSSTEIRQARQEHAEAAQRFRGL